MDDAPVQQPGPSLGEDLIVGAGPIAQFVYNDKKAHPRYLSNVLGLPLFHHGAQLAAFKEVFVSPGDPEP